MHGCESRDSQGGTAAKERGAVAVLVGSSVVQLELHERTCSRLLTPSFDLALLYVCASVRSRRILCSVQRFIITSSATFGLHDPDDSGLLAVVEAQWATDARKRLQVDELSTSGRAVAGGRAVASSCA